jgi:hypothetical protein
VLDAWVNSHAATVRQQFAAKETVKARAFHLPTPVLLEDSPLPELKVEHLQPIFAKQRSRLVIFGEGGGGKTSLACQIGRWAMHSSPADRLSAHLMLPVLIETDLLPVGEKKSALLETIRGQLQMLIDAPEPLCEELLLRLLRQRRILVIIDNFSELNPQTQQAVQPDSPEFPVNALLMTSRSEAILSGVNRVALKPLRLKSQDVSSFLTVYGRQEQATSLSNNKTLIDTKQFSHLIGNSDITLLLAKLYAKASCSAATVDLAELMLSYLNELNRGLIHEQLDDRTVHQAAKSLAWACVQQQLRLAPIRRSEALRTLSTTGSAQPTLDYLEYRLSLIQTIGAAQEEVQFVLAPLANYLAAIHLVELFADHENKWQAGFFQKQHELDSPGAQAQYQDFRFALNDCYYSKIAKSNPEDTVWQQLQKLCPSSKEYL